MTIEYKVVTQQIKFGDDVLEAFLNEHGKDGWEVVSLTPDTKKTHSVATVHAVFKRADKFIMEPRSRVRQ